MLDAAKLWKRGVRAVVVTFDTFLVAAQDQAKAMAMPEIPIVVIPHVKAGETSEDFRGRAEEALDEDLDPHGDLHADAATKRHLANVLARRVLGDLRPV